VSMPTAVHGCYDAAAQIADARAMLVRCQQLGKQARPTVFKGSQWRTDGEFLDQVHVLAVLECSVQRDDVLVMQRAVDLDLPRHLHDTHEGRDDCICLRRHQDFASAQRKQPCAAALQVSIAEAAVFQRRGHEAVKLASVRRRVWRVSPQNSRWHALQTPHLVPVELRQLVLAVQLQHDAQARLAARCAVQQARLAAVQLLLQVIVVQRPARETQQ